jgi:hypothetical protein
MKTKTAGMVTPTAPKKLKVGIRAALGSLLLEVKLATAESRAECLSPEKVRRPPQMVPLVPTS